MKTWTVLATVAALVSGGAAVSAHHSFGAEYDANKPITLNGVVTKIEWTNPHTHMYLDVKGADGKVVNWKLEGFPPVVLYRTGWKRGVTLKEGDQIVVTGWQARDGGDWGHTRQVTFADGKQLFFGPPAGTGDGGGRPAADLPAQQ
jgi:hypothetical protein